MEYCLCEVSLSDKYLPWTTKKQAQWLISCRKRCKARIRRLQRCVLCFVSITSYFNGWWMSILAASCLWLYLVNAGSLSLNTACVMCPPDKYLPWNPNSISCMVSVLSALKALRGFMLPKEELSVHILVPETKDTLVVQTRVIQLDGHMISHKRQS